MVFALFFIEKNGNKITVNNTTTKNDSTLLFSFGLKCVRRYNERINKVTLSHSRYLHYKTLHIHHNIITEIFESITIFIWRILNSFNVLLLFISRSCIFNNGCIKSFLLYKHCVDLYKNIIEKNIGSIIYSYG